MQNLMPFSGVKRFKRIFFFFSVKKKITQWKIEETTDFADRQT